MHGHGTRNGSSGRARRPLLVIALVAGALVAGATAGSADADGAGSWIVVLKDPRVSPAALAKAHGLAPTHVYGSSIHGFAASIPDAAVARLRASPAVAYVEKDGLAFAIGDVGPTKKPDNPGGGKPGGGGGEESEPPQTLPWGIARVGGGEAAPANALAWVIDTGVDLDHPDLNVAVELCANFVTRGRQKQPGDDGNGHGTHVAGTIGAIDNAIDVVGVAAGATIVSVRVLDNSGSGTISGVIAGIDYVAANGTAGDVANMSLGAAGEFQSLEDAVAAAADKGIRFAIAAGNDGEHASGHSPARVEHPNVVTVSAIDAGDVFAWFSNFGNPPVDWAAPGVAVLSTQKGGGVTTLSGTSMATPHVAGLLLLGEVRADGAALEDPDGVADPIAHR